MRDASQASARVDNEARSHRRVAVDSGGQAKEAAREVVPACGARPLTAPLAHDDTPAEGQANNEETRLLRVSQE